jgi:putative transposase
MKELSPTSPSEAVAVFRHGIIGSLTQAQLERGQLRQALEQLSAQRFRPPGAQSTRQYSVTTLERWYYAWQRRGLEGLKPRPRSDRGRAQALPSEVRQLLLDIRREHPNASVPLILRTLTADGRMDAYSGEGEHLFQPKPSSHSGHGEQSERQRRWWV